ncbi:ADP-ribosylglycohydrolase family protein [Paenibacillus mendelii]|uniref:ADP-ribosylglycohydrolase family protein n=1 Tax=Paenibacillus mendelii TaxID=206163 RepID=A0ABV6J266_9BACL|nr:ADP-ribosylglycohydrolase family protein [Paenibacillus mendelii]MCQ6560549.1 ADP-ribosylglycohydrolase family protein [Paenibacillus mendelii]
MILNETEYRNKVLGCWMGKNIGGTLGAPFEFMRQINRVSFYTQELDGSPVPNDDLDIQLLWLIALEEKGIDLNARLLGEYWLHYVTPHWAEYGIAKVNMRAGLLPPLSGTANNVFKHSNGAFIRSEIWACIAPGYPELAARYAYQDAIIDHGNGEGVYAEVFCAALESAAFVERNIETLIAIGLSYIPEDCGVALAIRHVIQSFRQGLTWEEARDDLLRHHRGKYAVWAGISLEDEEKGFKDGIPGWDAPSNLGIVILGLLYGEGDFDKTLCTAVNCGEDTDCTAATLGALFGIMYGLEAIPKRWITPIGAGIKTACLNLGELGVYGDQLPADIHQLTDRVTVVAKRVIAGKTSPLILSDEPTQLADMHAELLYDHEGKFQSIYAGSSGTAFRFDFFEVVVDYGEEGAVIHAGEPKTIRLIVHNHYKISDILNIRWYGPDGFNLSPAGTAKLFSAIYPDTTRDISFEVSLASPLGTNRFVVELTLDGRNTVMLVPVVLLGNHRSV